MTHLHPRDPENRQQNRFSERRFSKKKTQLNEKAWLGLLGVDLIGEKNHVILEIRYAGACSKYYGFAMRSF